MAPVRSARACPAPRADIGDWLEVHDTSGITLKLPPGFVEKGAIGAFRRWDLGSDFQQSIEFGVITGTQDVTAYRRVPTPGFSLDYSECDEVVAGRRVYVQAWRQRGGVFRNFERLDKYEAFAVWEIRAGQFAVLQGGGYEPRVQELVLAAIRAWRAAGPLAAQAKAVRFGTLVDGTGRVLSDAVVVVEGDRIVSVGTGSGAVPRGAEVIDLRRYTGIPGLIDVHTHLTYWRDPRPAARAQGQPATPRLPAVTVFLSQDNAKRTLESGVTTVRDLGASDYSDIAMRELINRGAMVGPRMFVSGYGLTKPRTSARAGAPPAVPRGRVTDTSEIAQAVQAQVDAGADWIKMYGSTGSGADVSGRQTFTLEEMKAAVDAAHRARKRIAIHSYGPEGARDAVRAGAESVEHAVDLDDATLAEMAARGTFYVPTIDHNRYYAESREFLGYTAEQAVALDAFRARNVETARRAFKAGVRFAMGSDVVYTMFGQNTRELGFFVEIGMSPAQALATATTNAAALLGLSDRLGAVAPGYFADLVAVEGNPLADISVVLHKVRWVMKGGAVVVQR